jgi:glyoxylase I family protein
LGDHPGYLPFMEVHMPALSGIHHLALTVSDADRSAAWYGDILRLTEVLRGDDEVVSYRVLAGESFFLGVRQYHAADSDEFDEFRTGLDHVAFTVNSRPELEQWEQLLAERGISYTPIKETPIGTVITFRDPDNIQVEFWLSAGN